MTEAVLNLFPSPVILETLRSQVSEHQKVYLVGGAVRDMLMQRRGRDLDFVVMGDALRLARRVADALGAGYYALDTERQTGRVIYTDEENKRWHLDFSLMRGGTIQEDLAARDFTINALAIRLDQLGQIIDPLHGAQDIKDRRLRACSPQAFHDDPLRVLRGVRLASEFGSRMTPETLAGLKAAVPGLAMVSVERQRDELFNILENPHSVAGLRVGFSLGVFDHLLPEVVALSGEIQDAPHIHDVFEHTLALVESLDTLFDLLVKPYSEDKSASLIYGLAVVTLGRFRQQLAQHFSTLLHPERSLIALVKLTGLLHDIAKPATRTVDDQERMHFYGHEKLGGELVAQRHLAGAGRAGIVVVFPASGHARRKPLGQIGFEIGIDGLAVSCPASGQVGGDAGEHLRSAGIDAAAVGGIGIEVVRVGIAVLNFIAIAHVLGAECKGHGIGQEAPLEILAQIDVDHVLFGLVSARAKIGRRMAQ